MPPNQQITELTLPLFDDFHLHLRAGNALKRTVSDASFWARRAIVMPNLQPPVDNFDLADNYRADIIKNIPAGRNFEALMTLYLSENIKTDTVKQAKERGIFAIKWYPKGATTNSEQGISSVQACYPIFAEMEKRGVPLLIHGEVTDTDIDIFEREAVFIDRVLIPLRRDFPALQITLEHITTARAVEYLLSIPEAEKTAATITPQHLLFNRNQLLVGGIKPHFYCLPILKCETDRKALLQAATSGNPRFFLGTDSAPHAQHKKENSCGCAGCYSAWNAPALYAQAFEEAGALDKLENFACKFGADFYDIATENYERVLKISREENTIPANLDYAEDKLIPLFAENKLNWQIKKN